MPQLVRATVLVLVLLTLALAAGVASATAVVRYASPTGAAATSDCTSPDPLAVNPPCTLTRAVGQVAVDGDEVIVAPGDYNLGSSNLQITKAISVHGADGQARPRILSSSPNFGVGMNAPTASLRRVAIEYSGPLEALDNFRSAVVEQVIVHTTGVYACLVRGDSTLRDSVCLDTAPNGIGTELQTNGTFSANLRNVTTVATGTGSFGIQVEVPNTGQQQNVVAKNVIADGVSADVHAFAGGGAVGTVTLSNSNYSSELETGLGTATVTNPGTGVGNQTAAPLFTDAGAGLFHEAVGSPTIDAGAAVDLMGSADIDADPRTVGAAPDIGADEFVSSPPTPPASVPSNAFTIGAITRNKKKGTATLSANVPNPGELTASGSGVKASSAGRAVTSKSVGAGQAQLLIKATGKKKRKLNETGKVKLSVAVTYTPTGGSPNTQSVKVKLKKKL
jgi:hypothetical protein